MALSFRVFIVKTVWMVTLIASVNVGCASLQQSVQPLISSNNATYDPALCGNLLVETVPPVQTTISLNGLPRSAWGLNYVKLPPGPYTISLTDVAGWQTPSSVQVRYNSGPWKEHSIDEPVQIAIGITTEVKATFSQMGNLWVQTSPALPATLYVNGNPMNEWGFWTNLVPGQYTVSFQEIPGFNTPSPISITLTAGLTTHIVGDYDSGKPVIVP
jgi:hypothetical protein